MVNKLIRLVSLRLIFSLIILGNLSAMEPAKETLIGERTILGKFIKQEDKNNYDYYNMQSNFTLERVLRIISTVLTDKNEMDIYTKEFKKNADDINNILNRIQLRVQSVLKKRTEKVAKFCSTEKKPSQAPSNYEMSFLDDFIEAEIAGDDDYINSRPICIYRIVIDVGNEILNKKITLGFIQKKFNGITEQKLREIIAKVVQKASAALKRAQV